MPRPRKPARLYFRRDEKQFVIRDGDKQIRTGYGAECRRETEAALTDYIAGREPPARRGPADPSDLTVGEALAHYAGFKADSLVGGRS